MLTGTEGDIINTVARLRKATKDQIRKQVGFSLDYIGFLCRDLVRRGYLGFFDGHYFLEKNGIKTLLTEETSKVDRKLLKEIAGEVAKEISGELKKTVKGIKVPISISQIKKEEEDEGQIKIKTDFELPVEDETLALESNINKIGANLEKEKSDIDKSIELFKKFKKGGKR